MVLLITHKSPRITRLDESSSKSNQMEQNPTARPVKLRKMVSSADIQTSSIKRRSLNVSSFNALQNAVSNLARIDDFDLEELGYGFFSDVFKATHKQTGKVLVLKRNKDTNTKLNILREVQLMNRLSHPNILKFKGVCVHEGQLHALTEFINGGDLEQLVIKKDPVLTWKQRMHLALDVANGLKYLHSVGIFHRDLSAKNCLVQVNVDRKGKKKYSCVVADLGLAEKIPTCAADENRLAMVGTPYIMAPEVLKGKPYNEKADVFSFGLLVCQLIALVSSDPEELPRSSDFGLARDLFSKVVASSPAASDASPDTSFPPPKLLLQLAYDCCQLEPKSRPSFNEVVKRLEDMIAARKCRHVGRSTSFKAYRPSKKLQASSRDSSLQRNSKQRSDTNADLSPRDDQPPHYEKRKRYYSTSAKLSRSFSDISRELLSHAANMVASSSLNSDDDSTEENDEYSNPFSAFELLNGGQMKLTDEPSRALLEMTFDLATFDSLKSSWGHPTNSMAKSRPKSSYMLDSNISGDHHFPYSPVSSLHLNAFRDLHSFESRSVPHSPRVSTSEETLTQCGNCNYQRALHRAMILSPLGNNLASWWCSRQRTSVKSSIENERHSLASVMALLSRNVRNLRHSISLPDLSRTTVLFHSSDDCASVENKYSIVSGRSRRSKTSEEVFYQDSKQDSIVEESETDLVNLKSCLPQFENDRLQTAISKPLGKITVDMPGNAEGHLLNDDAGTEALHINHLSIQGDTIKEEESHPALKDDDCSSSNTLSYPPPCSFGCSNQGVFMTLKTGDVTRDKRRSLGRTSHKSATSTDNFANLNNNNPVSHNVPSSLSLETPGIKSNNRDSGYEEDGSHSTVSPSNEHSNHHVTWDIPEEPSSASLPEKSW